MQTKLAAHATKLSRSIFASLPWGFRLAHLFSKLAIDTQEAFGRFCYAEFLKAGVVGLPDINGQPALSLRDKIQGPRAADRLPRGYGREFGTRVWKMSLAKIHNPELVEEAISRVMVRMVSHEVKIREGSDLKSAEKYILTSVFNSATDLVRKDRRETPLTMEDDDGGAVEMDIDDPGAFKDIAQMIPKSEMAKILRDLRSVNERAPAWVEAQLDGLSNVEIAEEWGVSPAYVLKWTKTYIDRIQAVFNKYLRAAA